MKDSDNRLLLSLKNENSIFCIYKDYLKNNYVEITEVEEGCIGGSIVEDNTGKKYISECVFTFLRTNMEQKNNLLFIENQSRAIYPFKNGWLYIKIYGCEDRELELLDFIYNLNINAKIFFIRYFDKIGSHLRVRFKFDSAEKATIELNKLIEFFEEMSSRGLINHIGIDTYLPEIERYGGISIYSQIENFFFVDSKYVLELSQNINNDNKEYIFLSGIIPIFFNLHNNVDDIVEMLEEFDNIDVKREYHKNKKIYMENFKEIIFKKSISDRDLSLIKIKEYINRISDKRYKNYIIMSISHMFCNRMGSNREYEEYLMIIISYIIKDYKNML